MTDPTVSRAPAGGLEPDRPRYCLIPPQPSESSDRRVLVTPDPFGDGLLVIPVAQARLDVDVVHALTRATTVGEVRRCPLAWDVLVSLWDADSDADDPDTDRPRTPSECPEEEPIDASAWDLDRYRHWLPVPRLRAAETAPQVVWDRFARPDPEVGMDYRPAPWFALDDTDDITAVLTASGYTVVQDPALASGYDY